MAPIMPKCHTAESALVRFATRYDEVVDDEGDGGDLTFEVPADLSEVETVALSGLLDSGREAFDALFGEDGSQLSAEQATTLSAIADGVDAVRTELASRDAERATRQAAAAELAARVHEGTEELEVTDDGIPQKKRTGDKNFDAEGTEELANRDYDDDEDDKEAAADTAEASTETVTAAAAPRGPISVTLSGVGRRRRQPSAPVQTEEQAPRATLVAAADIPGHSTGSEITFADVAEAFAARSRGVNRAQYEAAFHAGRRLTQSFGLASVHKPYDADMIINDDNDAETVLARASDPSRLPGGALTAAGWCAPSETIYDLVEWETRDGLFSLPEIVLNRGGLRHTLGPDFQSIFTEDSLSWVFTEDEVADGDYDGSGGGTKPFYKVPCPEFVDDRLDVAGLSITAGILQNRAYPETIARFIRGALIAHEHKMAGRVLTQIAAGSTSVAMPANQAGAVAPLLTAIEVQVEDLRNRHRLSRSLTLECVLPIWAHGALRSDLSRRLGIDLINVTNGTINSYLAERGVAPQFVYNYDDLTGTAANRNTWPDEIKFLLYPAGTWVRGAADLITLEAVYDSAMFRVNEFTALFTEEGWNVMQRGHDSREVTVNISADGSTHGGIEIDHDGSVTSAT